MSAEPASGTANSASVSDSLLALAIKCEAASGADRELDAAIVATQGLRVVNEGHPLGRRCYGKGGVSVELPRYTASLDAAMTLVDKHGVLMHLSDIGADGLPYARVGRPDLDDGPIFTGTASCIMTNTSPVAGLALALCAAALRARVAGEAA